MTKRRRRIFVSVGRRERPHHVRFVAALKELIEASGHDAYFMPNSYENPLDRLCRELRECDGMLVICFERIFAASAIEFRESQNAKPPIEPLVTPTVWNHVEAALARSLGLPVLILAEEGCRADGMLDSMVQIKTQWLEFEPEQLSKPHVRQLFDGWLRAMDDRASTGGPTAAVADVSELRVWDVLKGLRFGEAVGLMVAIGAVFSAGWWLGSIFPYPS